MRPIESSNRFKTHMACPLPGSAAAGLLCQPARCSPRCPAGTASPVTGASLGSRPSSLGILISRRLRGLALSSCHCITSPRGAQRCCLLGLLRLLLLGSPGLPMGGSASPTCLTLQLLGVGGSCQRQCSGGDFPLVLLGLVHQIRNILACNADRGVGEAVGGSGLSSGRMHGLQAGVWSAATNTVGARKLGLGAWWWHTTGL